SCKNRPQINLRCVARQCVSCVLRQANTCTLPAAVRCEKVSVATSHVTLRRETRATAQNHLIAHELGVVLAKRPGPWLVAGIGDIRTCSPMPHVSIKLRRTR